MKKLKIYNVNELLLKENGIEAFRYKKVAIFESRHGIVIADEEAVHKCENLVTDSIAIEANTPAGENRVTVMPNRICFVIIKEILEKARYEEMTIEEFYNRKEYNSRFQRNWAILMDSLKNIEFDLNEYFKEET